MFDSVNLSSSRVEYPVRYRLHTDHSEKDFESADRKEVKINFIRSPELTERRKKSKHFVCNDNVSNSEETNGCVFNTS